MQVTGLVRHAFHVAIENSGWVLISNPGDNDRVYQHPKYCGHMLVVVKDREVEGKMLPGGWYHTHRNPAEPTWNDSTGWTYNATAGEIARGVSYKTLMDHLGDFNSED